MLQSTVKLVSGSNSETGHMQELATDTLGLFERAAKESYGIAEMKFGPYPFYLISDPSYIKQVLSIQATKFIKPGMTEWKMVMGKGLITSEGEHWLNERRLVQPAFSKKRIRNLYPIMEDSIINRLESWKDHTCINLTEEMKFITIQIGLRTLFGVNKQFDSSLIISSLNTIMEYIHDKSNSQLRYTGESMQKSEESKFLSAIHNLEDIVEDIIQQDSTDDGNLLKYLQSKENIDKKIIRDEVITHLLAGYESTATSLAWTIYLIKKHPQVEEKILKELSTVSNENFKEEIVWKFSYLAAVYAESLRLFPPSWSILRMSTEPFKLGEREFPKGTQVYISQYITQRLDKFYKDSNQFIPERWMSPEIREVPSFVYFPFGEGVRKCVGQDMALQEALIILYYVLKNWNLELNNNNEIKPKIKITLQPSEDIILKINKKG